MCIFASPWLWANAVYTRTIGQINLISGHFEIYFVFVRGTSRYWILALYFLCIWPTNLWAKCTMSFFVHIEVLGMLDAYQIGHLCRTESYKSRLEKMCIGGESFGRETNLITFKLRFCSESASHTHSTVMRRSTHMEHTKRETLDACQSFTIHVY